MGDERRINQLTAKSYGNIGSSDYFAVDNASEAESKKLPASSIKTPISNLEGEVTGGSDTYSSTKNYSVGMYVTHTTGGVQKLYRCKTACTAASWTTNASCFEEANLTDAVSQLNNDLSKHTFDTAVNLSSYNSENAYSVPTDGYFFISCTNITNNRVIGYINSIAMLCVSSPSNAPDTSFPRTCCFVRKGMKIYAVATSFNTQNNEAYFYPLK